MGEQCILECFVIITSPSPRPFNLDSMRLLQRIPQPSFHIFFQLKFRIHILRNHIYKGGWVKARSTKHSRKLILQKSCKNLHISPIWHNIRILLYDLRGVIRGDQPSWHLIKSYYGSPKSKARACREFAGWNYCFYRNTSICSRIIIKSIMGKFGELMQSLPGNKIPSSNLIYSFIIHARMICGERQGVTWEQKTKSRGSKD